MENLNLVELLKDAPKGTKLYSPICGECELKEVSGDVIYVKGEHFDETFYIYGTYYHCKNLGECLLFPSKDNRDWSTFKVEKEKTKEVITHTLHRILDLVTTRKNLVGVEMSNESVMNVVSVLAKDTLEYIDKYWER